MLAIPPKRVFTVALIGETPTQRIRSAYKDALEPSIVDLPEFKEIEPPPKPISLAGPLIAAAVYGILFLFVLPRLPSDEPPGPVGHALSILFPGSARKWGVFGAPVLLAWLYFLIQLFMLKRGSPYFVTYIATADIARAYGAPIPWAPLINPPWWWLYIPPALLFIVNFFIIRHERIAPPTSSLIPEPQHAHS